MTKNFWYCFSVVWHVFIIYTDANAEPLDVIVENIIPSRITLTSLRMIIRQSDGIILYDLYFIRTHGFLANSRTPVLIYHDDDEGTDKRTKFHHDYEVMREIGNFSFYQDIDNKASAVLFADSDGIYLDGIIKDEFRLDKFPVDYLSSALKKTPQHIVKPISSISRLDKKTSYKLRYAARKGDVSYPELLIVLDYNLIADTSRTEAIRRQLVYWNAVDMLFASMKSPKIYLNIAAFVLPSSQHAFPFLETSPDADFVDFYDAMDGVETLFYKYRHQITFDYDIIVAITGEKLCVKATRANPVMNCINGFSEGKPDTVDKFDFEREAVDSSAILHYDNRISSYTNAAQKIGFMFTGEYTKKKEQKKCPGIMEEYYRLRQFSLSWSKCTRKKVANYLESPKAQGLKNFPKYLLEEEKIQLLTTEAPKMLADEANNVISETKQYLPQMTEEVLEPNEEESDAGKSDFNVWTTFSPVEATEVPEEVSKTMEEVPITNEPNVESRNNLLTSEASSSEEVDLTTTPEPLPLETTVQVLELTEEVTETTQKPIEKIPEMHDSGVDDQQDYFNSESSSSKQNDLTTTTESLAPETTLNLLKLSEDVTEINNLPVDDQQVFTNSEALVNDLSTTLDPNAHPPLETSSKMSAADEINVTSDPSDYSTTKPEDEKNESSNIEPRVGEEKINTLESINDDFQPRNKDSSSTTMKSFINKRQVRRKSYNFVDVTMPSEKSSNSVENNYADISGNNLISTTVNSILNRQNLWNEPTENPIVSTPVTLSDKQTEIETTYETTEQLSTEQYSEQNDLALDTSTSINNEATTQSVIEKYTDQNEPVTSTEKLDNTDTTTESISEQYLNQENTVSSMSTSTSGPFFVSILNRASLLNESLTDLVLGNLTTEVSTTSSTEPTTLTSTQSSCKRESLGLNVTLQLNINTNDKNIETLKRTFHSDSLNQENKNATDINDNNRVVKNIIDYLLKNSDQ